MKYKLRILMSLLLIVGLVTGLSTPVSADGGATDTDSINEKLGVPIVVYGDTLTDDQKAEVRELLEVTDSSTVEEYNVTGQDIANYIDGDPNSRMFSSAKIVKQEKGNGLTINIVTQDNITEVTKEMYANALLTAGVEDATVDVVSPVKVSGHSALTGIYKAYDVDGEELDKDRMEIANEELDVATDLAKKDGMSQEKVTELLTEIKKEIADQNPATKEDVEKIVKEQLDKLDISLNDADRQLLIDLFEKMRDLDIDFGKVKDQLEDLASTVKDKMDELGLDEGFWEKVANFFKSLFDQISNLFK
ncbi:uncharacterized protein YpuA (DUF1002 family) [Virgibacillus halotolerans]|uniref:DUF1002 domain-containing protein n=1 Tax=Virgibacillus halotolerans TaxID=1071053 RepID=UPI0019606AFB|nr:DUF1002 domain-containing protein [Virgibacillus halotolerans]MBM7600756.1 uncharacterized protein YpuA (DUF1002 family) [Virgibacillus halotolerans]